MRMRVRVRVRMRVRMRRRRRHSRRLLALARRLHLAPSLGDARRGRLAPRISVDGHRGGGGRRRCRVGGGADVPAAAGVAARALPRRVVRHAVLHRAAPREVAAICPGGRG